MKTLTLSVCLLCGLAATAQTQPASVGIQTENPQGVLHIDGGATAAQPSDDVIIDAAGRLGVGVLAPAAKVDIYATAPGGAIRIQDGSQGDRKVLTSDADGATSWTEIPGSWWYAALIMSAVNNSNTGDATLTTHPMTNYSGSLISVTDEGAINPTAGTITVPFTGSYRILISAHYNSRRTGGIPYWGKNILYVAPGDGSNKISRWTPSVWGTTGGYGSMPSYSTVLELQAGDVLSISLDATHIKNAPYGNVQAFGVEFLQ